MGRAPAEPPAAYVLATRFHETIGDIMAELGGEHDELAVELLKYSERILGNVGAAEAPYARGHRRLHYRMAFGALCGCAAACERLTRLRLVSEPRARRANGLLGSLATLVRPIAVAGLEPGPDGDAAGSR